MLHSLFAGLSLVAGLLPEPTPIRLSVQAVVRRSPIVPSVSVQAVVQRSPVTSGEALFPTSQNIAFIQPAGLGAPKASKANPGGAGNAEGNWWTPSDVNPNDVEAK